MTTAGAPLVVRIAGKTWDLERIEEFETQLKLAYDHPETIVDLSEATYIDTTVLGAFVRKRRYREAKGYPPSRLVLSPQVNRVFSLVAFDRIWQIYDTLDGALSE